MKPCCWSHIEETPGPHSTMGNPPIVDDEAVGRPKNPTTKHPKTY